MGREAKPTHCREHGRDPAQLIGIHEVAALLSLTVSGTVKATYRPGFPAPAQHLGNKRLWQRAAVEAYAAGRRKPKKPTQRKSPHSEPLFRDLWPEAIAAERLRIGLFGFRDSINAGHFPKPDQIGGPGWGKRERLWRAETLQPFVAGGGK